MHYTVIVIYDYETFITYLHDSPGLLMRKREAPIGNKQSFYRVIVLRYYRKLLPLRVTNENHAKSRLEINSVVENCNHAPESGDAIRH